MLRERIIRGGRSETIDRCTFLLIDDGDDTRELFGLALVGAGADVRTASDASDAMRTVPQGPPDVVVSDLSMPGMDCATLLRKGRSVDQLRHIPAVAVRGLAQAKHRADALAAGFQAHVSKPVAPEDLVALVERWAGTGSRSIDEHRRT